MFCTGEFDQGGKQSPYSVHQVMCPGTWLMRFLLLGFFLGGLANPRAFGGSPARD